MVQCLKAGQRRLAVCLLAHQNGNILQTMLWTRNNARRVAIGELSCSKSLIGRTVRVLLRRL